MTQSLQPAQKIMVAMSGGVDSSVTAALLKKQGYTVSGVFMTLAQPDVDQQVKRVEKIADFLEISLEVVDLSEPFKKEVLTYFSESYRNGKTPNPCIFCNRMIKFGKLLEHASSQGALMATGHYVRTDVDQNGTVRLLQGLDPRKDQSYFLCRLTQDQLKQVRFPLGETTKLEVYEVAAELGLKGMHGSESQDVCFMENKRLADFFASQPMKTGDFVTQAGKKVGTHRGICHYTVGQRRGLGICDATPYYVVGLKPELNQVIVGKDADLWQNWLQVSDMNWLIGAEPDFSQDYTVKIRYRHQAARARISQQDGQYMITFAEPQRAITPGQFAVVYQEDQVIGGGEIL